MKVALLSSTSPRDLAWAKQFLDNPFDGVEFRHICLPALAERHAPVERNLLDALHRDFPFAFLALPRRNKSVESVARKMSIPCAAITQAPRPVRAWLVASWWNACLPKDHETPPYPEGDLLYLLPKDQGYVERFTPLFGKNTDHLYRDDVHKILVPIDETLLRKCADTHAGGLGEWIDTRLPRQDQTVFFLAPMDEAAIAIITDIPEHSHLFWVGSNAVRNRYLSLLDKVDAVLAHDTATALLPTFMDRHCVTEVSVGHDVALCLTDVANYVHGGFRSNFETMRSPLLHHYLERGLISERCFTAEQLENSIQGYRRDLCIGINWDSQVRECWRTRSARKKSSARKKLRKLLRDPYKYCDDSKNRFVRFCRIFFEK